MHFLNCLNHNHFHRLLVARHINNETIAVFVAKFSIVILNILTKRRLHCLKRLSVVRLTMRFKILLTAMWRYVMKTQEQVRDIRYISTTLTAARAELNSKVGINFSTFFA